MATSRTYPSPVNLKDRIAALQQRNVSPSQQQTSQFAAKTILSSGTGGLRDKIAKFEEKGGVPVPRGSFGMGAPQLPENAPARKRGELYGNRIQGLGKLAGTPPSRSCSPILPAARDDSPSPRKRCVSTGGALLKGTPPRFSTDDPAPPLPPTPTLSFARRNSLAVDFGPAKSIVSSDEISRGALEDCELPSPSPYLSPSLGAGEAPGIASPSQSSLEHVAPPKDALPKDAALSLAGKELEITELASHADSALAPAMALNVTTTSQSSQEVTLIAEPDQTNSPALDELSRTSHCPPLSLDTSGSDVQPSEAAPPVTVTSQSSPEVIPVVEVTFTVDPGQTNSPALDELSRISHYPALPMDTSRSDSQPSEAALPGSRSTTTISSPIIAPDTEHDSSESTAATSKERDNTAKSLSASKSPVKEEPETISISVPHPGTYVQPSLPSPELNTGTTKAEVKRSFTAVVHRKVTEMPAATTPTPTLSAPITPQIARMRRTGITISAEPLLSPGNGELATLLEEAALLEMRLTAGDISIPSELQQAAPPTPSSGTFTPDVRSASSVTLTEHVKAPSTDSASPSQRSVSIPSIREPSIGGHIIEEDEVDRRSLASTSASQRSHTHRKYLSSIRRLTGRRSSNYMPGAYPRDSISTCSEDSAAITTPSDHGDGSSESFGIAWPSASPKKGSMGRSTSFADKLFNRNRTKSHVSTPETDQGSIYNSPSRSFTLSQPPSPSPTKSSQGRHVPEVQSSRSSSWTSPRDSSSSPSPSILDKEIFDAFPSVPQTLPPGPVHLSPDFSEVAVRRLSTIPVKGRKPQQQRLSMV